MFCPKIKSTFHSQFDTKKHLCRVDQSHTPLMCCTSKIENVMYPLSCFRPNGHIDFVFFKSSFWRILQLRFFVTTINCFGFRPNGRRVWKSNSVHMDTTKKEKRIAICYPLLILQSILFYIYSMCFLRFLKPLSGLYLYNYHKNLLTLIWFLLLLWLIFSL